MFKILTERQTQRMQAPLKCNLRCAIMQPTFFPWAGYFRLMTKVDNFVFLDDVQLVRQSWQTRNRVIVSGKTHWIIAPTQHVALGQTIADTFVIQSSPWRRKLGCLLRHAYAQHPFFFELVDLIQNIECDKKQTLAELNISIIEFCRSHLSIATPVLCSSTIPFSNAHRTTRLIEVCRYLGCTTYISPLGSSEYLAEDGFTSLSEIKLKFFDCMPPPYPQRKSNEFISHMSIIDVVANLGWTAAGEYIRGEWLSREIAK